MYKANLTEGIDRKKPWTRWRPAASLCSHARQQASAAGKRFHGHL